MQGASSLSDLATQYLFKDDLRFSPSQLALVTGVITAPWVLKPVFGFVSDSLPIFGMRRRPYLLAFGALGSLCYFAVYRWARASWECILALLGASLSICFVNVIAEALIVERGNSHSHTRNGSASNGNASNGNNAQHSEQQKRERRDHISRLMTIYVRLSASFYCAHYRVFADPNSGE